MRLGELFEECLNAQYQQAECKVHYAIERAGNSVRLFFQHSRDPQDWRYNLDFPVHPYRMGGRQWFCHRGFLRAWKAVEPCVAEAVGEGSVQQVLVAGYSHGAALAVLCHEYIWYHYGRLRANLQGFGFACPRVIWGCSPKARWENFTVIRNYGDPVPHLPPAIMGYRHVGRMVVIGEKRAGFRIEAHLPKAMRAALKEYELR